MKGSEVHLGFEIGSGKPVTIPLRHMVVTGQTQEAGKTTTLEALIARAGVSAVAFITKRGEGSFKGARIIQPYFSEQTADSGFLDWRYVASILEASLGEKLKFERGWIMRASKGARSLADVQINVKTALADPKTRGLSADVYFQLDTYLQAVVPEIQRTRWAPRVDLAAGLNAMDLGPLKAEMQFLVIRSTIEWVLQHAEDTIVIVPEAWKFIPQGRNTPVKLAAEAFIRQAAALRNYLWLDSQDIAGVEKLILKSVPVWILGVQRERNEVEHTLKQIPVKAPKPTANQVTTLGLGEFFACYGTHVTKVYVQPKWMGQAEARAIAEGQIDAREALHPGPQVRPTAPVEDQVNEQEAKALRDENAELRDQVVGLKRRVDELLAHPLPSAERADTPTPRPRAPAAPVSELLVGEDLYQAIKARLMAEAPALLKVLVVKPELEIAVAREVLSIDGKTLRGRIARLIAEGFCDAGVTANRVQAELARRGKDPGPGNTYNEMKALAELGFVTIEEGKDDQSRKRTLYKTVPGMKVRILEAA